LRERARRSARAVASAALSPRGSESAPLSTRGKAVMALRASAACCSDRDVSGGGRRQR
jgi:hypothetical protein